jgi:transcriptional regulator with XRE-family HTH domain
MDFNNVSEVLRSLLKSRGITYKDVANKLEMSESGVKKLLTSEDISFNKLNAILGFLDLTLKDLISLKNRNFTKLNEKQEVFLLKHPQHYNFFAQFWHFGGNLDLLKAENHKLSKAKLNQYIEDLLKIGMLEMADGKLRSVFEDGYTTSDKFGQQSQKNVNSQVLKFANQPQDKKSEPWAFEGLGHFALSQKSALEYKVALHGLLEEFHKKSQRDRKTHATKDLVTCGSLLLSVPAKMKDLFPI